MSARRYRYTWDEIAALECDYIAGWGAFEPDRRETVEFDNEFVPQVAFKMASDGKSFSVVYQWLAGTGRQPAEFTQSCAELVRRPCRFGGTRTYFMCPCCGRTTLRLAVLQEGLRCGLCGGVTWDSRRQRPLQRLMRKADKIALQLGCEGWQEVPPEKPAHMHLTTFEKLKSERTVLVAEINREIMRRLSCRSKARSSIGLNP